MPLNPFNKCFGAATTKKPTIFRPKMAKKGQFLPQISVFWPRVVSSCTPYPILRMLDSKIDVLHAIEPIEQVFQGRHHHKKPFFAQKWPKNANFYTKSVFSPSRWLVPARPPPPPPPYFEGAGLKKRCVASH